MDDACTTPLYQHVERAVALMATGEWHLSLVHPDPSKGTKVFNSETSAEIARRLTARSEAKVQPDDDDFDWMMVEIFGHRRHFGRGKEVERFGSKMLRIDVPILEWMIPPEVSSEDPEWPANPDPEWLGGWFSKLPEDEQPYSFSLPKVREIYQRKRDAALGREAPKLAVAGWQTLFYGGASIFSNSLTDEETVMKRNRPAQPPHRMAALPAPAHHEQDDEEIPY